ncbi:MAG: putative sensor domain DACNV-containing protein [Vicinamibacteria bacterium]
MNSFVAEWPQDVFQKVVDAVAADRSRYTYAHTKRSRPPLPDDAQIRELIETALRASLDREEGRQADFSLVFCEPTEIDGMPFVTSEPFTAEALRRLMPSADSEVDGIAVSAGESGLQIWGIAERREDAVVIRAIAPGRVMACFGGSTIARFNGHTCSLLRVDRDQVLGMAAALLPEGDDPGNLVKMQFLWGLGMIMRGFGHGGTIVVLNGTPVPGTVEGGRDLRSLDVLTRKARPAIEELKQVIESDQQSASVSIGDVGVLHDLQGGGLATGELGELFRKIGRLTLVDGALVLDQGFAVLTAGAKLYGSAAVDTWWAWEPELPEWNKEEGSDGRFEGTRHSSALRFVAANPGTVALVCSQDGVLTFVGCPAGSDAPRIMKNLDLILT